MSATNHLFSPSELLAFETAYQRHRKAASHNFLTLIWTGMQAVVLAGLVVLEFNLFEQIFSFLKGPSLPGEEGHWSISLLALTGTVMMLAYHLYARRYPGSLTVTVIRRGASLLIPFYAFTGGLALASIVYFDGADRLGAEVAASSVGLFGSSVAAAPGYLDRLITAFPVMFSIACGGLAVINLFIADTLSDGITSGLHGYVSRRRSAQESRMAIATLRECSMTFTKLSLDRDAILAKDRRSHEIDTANDAMAAISEGLRPYEVWLTGEQVKVGADICFTPPSSNLDPVQIASRVAALRGITQKSILAALRGTKEP